MPIIARFYGIVIRIYSKEHGIPHFHANYGEFSGVFNIMSGQCIEGALPSRAEEMVRDWALKHQAELLGMWQSKKFMKLPGLE